MSIKLPRRFAVAGSWFREKQARRAGLPTFGELCGFLAQPSETKRGMRFVKSIRETDGVYEVTLLDYQEPLFWPVSWGLAGLGLVLGEQFRPSDWHYYQIPETRVAADDVVVDCGAAEGLFSLVASRVCKRCYCIEPAPSFQKFLKRTFANHTNVEILPYLISDHIGEARMTDTGITSHETADGSGSRIEVTTLDALFVDQARQFSYLKADVEGAEMRLLAGARKSIAAFRPRVAITTYHVHSHAEEISTFLREIHPTYRIRVKGVVDGGHPVMLHAW